jgi:hypothetical protein
MTITALHTTQMVFDSGALGVSFLHRSADVREVFRVSDDYELDQSTEPHVIVEDETLAAGFTQIPNQVLRRSDLQPGAKLTYMVLLSYAWQKNHAYPGQDVLARDMGVSDRSVRTYLDQLETSGLLSIRRRGLGLTNVYILHRLSRPENISDQDRKPVSAPERKLFPTKKTQTNKTQRDDSKGTEPLKMPARLIPQHERTVLERYAADYAVEFRDQAPLASTASRLVNLYADAGVDLETFLDLLQDARAATQKRSASIQAELEDGSGRKRKVPYFFAVLADLIEKRGA